MLGPQISMSRRSPPGCRVSRSWCLAMIASIFPAVSRCEQSLKSLALNPPKADLCWSTNSPTTCQPRSSAYFLELANWAGMRAVV